MEDYKEKYENILHDIDIAIAGQKEGETKIVLQNLKERHTESEDERIKKCIGMCLTDATEQRFEDFNTTLKDCLSWLEKQSEQKLEQEEDAELTDFESALFSAFSDAWQEYLSGKEVNVAKWTKEHSAELLEVARGQISAWSEEDEKHLLKCLNYFSCITEFTPDYDDFLWLKSLKERMKGE